MAALSENELLTLLGLGTFGILLLIGGMAIFIAVYQKRMIQDQESKRKYDDDHRLKMIQMQLESQEVERKRIAADLHDSVGSLLWGAKLTAAYVQKSVSLDRDQRKSMDELMEILDQSIVTVKRISWELTPAAFQYSGLSQSLASLCSRLNGKGFEVAYTEQGASFIWNDSRALLIFRIVQELLSNSIKHSGGSHISVKLSWSEESLIVEVTDDGKGFSLEDNRNGVGWWNINHRAAQLGAMIEMQESSTGKGSKVKITVHLSNEQ